MRYFLWILATKESDSKRDVTKYNGAFFTAADTEGGGADSSSTLTGGSGSGLSRRPYVRKRYTDTRHPTKELPDVRQDDSPPGDAGGLPTVQNPPASHRRQQQQDLKK